MNPFESPMRSMTRDEARSWLETDAGIQYSLWHCPTGTGETAVNVGRLWRLRQSASREAWSKAMLECITMYQDVPDPDEREILQFTWAERQLVAKRLTPPTYGDIAICDTCGQFVFLGPDPKRPVEIECCDYCMEGA